MIYILDIIACGLVVAGELIGAILGAMLIQLFFYRVLKINLVKSLFRGLDNLDKYLTTKLG